MSESKAMKLFYTISKEIKTKNVPYKNYITTFGSEIDYLYILVEGKVGLSKNSNYKLDNLSQNVLDFILEDQWFEILTKKNDLICENEVWK